MNSVNIATLNSTESRERYLILALRVAGIGLWEWNIPEERMEWSGRLYEIHGLQRAAFDGTMAKVSDPPAPRLNTDFLIKFRVDRWFWIIASAGIMCKSTVGFAICLALGIVRELLFVLEADVAAAPYFTN